MSTDDKNTEAEFIQLFGDRIILHNKKDISRNSKEGMIDAAIDLYNLSICEKIYGSYRSSFSDMAAEIGGIEKVILRTN